MKIVIQEIDKFFSTIHEGKKVSEYLICLTIGDTPLTSKAFTEIGEEAKELRVNELIVEHFMENNNDINLAEIIDERPLKKNKKWKNNTH